MAFCPTLLTLLRSSGANLLNNYLAHNKQVIILLSAFPHHSILTLLKYLLVKVYLS